MKESFSNGSEVLLNFEAFGSNFAFQSPSGFPFFFKHHSPPAIHQLAAQILSHRASFVSPVKVSGYFSSISRGRRVPEGTRRRESKRRRIGELRHRRGFRRWPRDLRHRLGAQIASLISDGALHALSSRSSFSSLTLIFDHIGYLIYSVRNKLKKQYGHLKGKQIEKIKKSGVEITDMILSPEIAFTGDTTAEYMLDPRNADALRAKVLITEVSF
ncbi:unnamed protein product [Microthlaspi erraticum]|uniref:Uncharacterized protein n=1 Tax=Microthlaspi erraticum TaxID=1685480 RepID=A0A6D2I6F5_9BRAS|nr:unnamed protein product [Microthlaspi erraticum]